MMKVPAAKILVIDDNSAVVDILATCLGGEGHTVLSALTSDEGLSSLCCSDPIWSCSMLRSPA
jgi:CheY-like chemotaxis protein